MSTPFWQSKTLFEMSTQEWESICDGCAKCCLTQLQDEESEQLVFTNVACNLLNDQTCRCSDYPNRSQRVPDCMTMTIDNVHECVEFAPSSCSYRLLLEGKPLPDWHHLVNGDRDKIHKQGRSVQSRVKFQRDVKEEDLEDHVIDWC